MLKETEEEKEEDGELCPWSSSSSDLEDDAAFFDHSQVNDSEVSARLLRKKSLSLQEIQAKRVREQVLFEKKKQQISDQEILTQVRMYALLVPSMEFIPDFQSFISVMQLGLVEDRRLRQKSKKRAGGIQAALNSSAANSLKFNSSPRMTAAKRGAR